MRNILWNVALSIVILMLTSGSMAGASVPGAALAELLRTVAESAPVGASEAVPSVAPDRTTQASGALPTSDPSFLSGGWVCNWDGCCTDDEIENLDCGDCAIGACTYDGICDFDESSLCSDCLDHCQPGGGSGGGGGGGGSGPCTPLIDGPDCD